MDDIVLFFCVCVIFVSSLVTFLLFSSSLPLLNTARVRKGGVIVFLLILLVFLDFPHLQHRIITCLYLYLINCVDFFRSESVSCSLCSALLTCVFCLVITVCLNDLLIATPQSYSIPPILCALLTDRSSAMMRKSLNSG